MPAPPNHRVGQPAHLRTGRQKAICREPGTGLVQQPVQIVAAHDLTLIVRRKPAQCVWQDGARTHCSQRRQCSRCDIELPIHWRHSCSIPQRQNRHQCVVRRHLPAAQRRSTTPLPNATSEISAADARPDTNLSFNEKNFPSHRYLQNWICISPNRGNSDPSCRLDGCSSAANSLGCLFRNVLRRRTRDSQPLAIDARMITTATPTKTLALLVKIFDGASMMANE